MPGTNEFKPFATGGGANVLSPAAYAALTSLLANGFSAGVAPSVQLNTVWRQASFVAAAVAQLIADFGPNAVDDGNLTTFVANLKAAIGGPTTRIAAAGGTVDAITGTFAPVPTTFINGLSYYVRAAGSNTITNPTFTPNSGTLAAKTIVKRNNQALVVGDIAGAGHWLELVYDSVLDKFILQNPNDLVDLGRAQSWQVVTGSRAYGVTYTNSTTQPITVNAGGIPGTGGNFITAVVGGTMILNQQSAGTENLYVSFIVPAGATYSVTSTGTSLVLWAELRT